jgi:CBS-domain-containing membrane protein
MTTTVFDVVHMFSERGISAVPIIDEEGVVVNLYETVDVIVSSSDSSTLLVIDPVIDFGQAWRLPVP